MPIDVILLTGFLGSGKTTLLKRILSWEEDLSGIIVLVNEFGEVGLDGKLLEGTGANIIEMTSGCICCSLQADLLATLSEIAKMNPRQVLIEATGVAKPAQAAAILAEPPLADLYQLKKIITVFDLPLWEAKEAMGNLFWDQLNQADLVLANKTDLLTDETANAYLADMHRELPQAVIIPTAFCDLKPDLIFTPATSDSHLKDVLNLHHHGLDSALFQSLVFQTSQPLSEDRLNAFLKSTPPNLYRIKGYVRFNRQTRFLNFSRGRADWQPWSDENNTQLVLIGQNLDEVALIGELNKCIEE